MNVTAAVWAERVRAWRASGLSATEFALFSPLFVYALRPRRLAMRPLAAGALTTTWLLAFCLIGHPRRDGSKRGLREATGVRGVLSKRESEY